MLKAIFKKLARCVSELFSETLPPLRHPSYEAGQLYDDLHRNSVEFAEMTLTFTQG